MRFAYLAVLTDLAVILVAGSTIKTDGEKDLSIASRHPKSPASSANIIDLSPKPAWLTYLPRRLQHLVKRPSTGDGGIRGGPPGGGTEEGDGDGHLEGQWGGPAAQPETTTAAAAGGEAGGTPSPSKTTPASTSYPAVMTSYTSSNWTNQGEKRMVGPTGGGITAVLLVFAGVVVSAAMVVV